VTAWLVALGPLLTGTFGPPGLVPFHRGSPVSAIDPSMLSGLSGLRAGESVIRAGAGSRRGLDFHVDSLRHRDSVRVRVRSESESEALAVTA
jgi:hypothetical protein